MTFLPLIERELRLRARSPAVYWTRFGVGLAGVLICVPQLMSATPWGTPAGVGRGVFDGLVCAAFLLICFVCLLISDALNAERREGTLGLLLLTRVRVLDVLLGKLGSIGIAGVCALVAFLPALALPILAGGVTVGEAFRKELALLNVLLFALAAGLFAAAAQRERFKAARLAICIVGGVALGPLLFRWLAESGPAAAVLAKVSLLSPLALLQAAGDVSYRASAGAYWLSLAALGTLSCALLVRANLRLRRSLQSDGGAPASRSQKLKRPAADVALPRNRRRFSGQASPVAWRVGSQRGLRATVWGAAAVSVPFTLGSVFLARFITPAAVSGISWSWSMGSSAIIGALIAWAVSRFFIESRRSGELELLLTTPVGAQTIVSEQWRALRRLLARPLVLMLTPILLEIVYLFIFLRFRGSTVWNVYNTVGFALFAVETVLGLGALCWLGLWFGLRARGQMAAILWSVGVAKGIPYGISSMIYVMGLRSMARARSFPSWQWCITYWTPSVLIVLFFLWAMRFARRRLLADLAAGQPLEYPFPGSLWAAWGHAAPVFRRARHWTPS
ncbi:MAG TPA: hypothetical protein VMU04_24410 [Candidatus Acidoferrum sp.]|nr:hypothetical protein [Candidatus Acidoferrum sp.]